MIRGVVRAKTWQRLRRLWCNDGPQMEYEAIALGGSAFRRVDSDEAHRTAIDISGLYLVSL